MHTGLVAGWPGIMLVYEIIIFDATDPVDNPMWRQGCYVMPFASRIGVVCSMYAWANGIEPGSSELYWTYETVSAAHILVSGFFVLASFWHWAYWDLDLFISKATGKFLLDLVKIFGIHLLLASVLCFVLLLVLGCVFNGSGLTISCKLDLWLLLLLLIRLVSR